MKPPHEKFLRTPLVMPKAGVNQRAVNRVARFHCVTGVMITVAAHGFEKHKGRFVQIVFQRLVKALIML